MGTSRGVNGNTTDGSTTLVNHGGGHPVGPAGAAILGDVTLGNLAVVFPRADAAHLRLARLLTERGLPFNDLLESAGPAGVEGDTHARTNSHGYAYGMRF